LREIPFESLVWHFPGENHAVAKLSLAVQSPEFSAQRPAVRQSSMFTHQNEARPAMLQTQRGNHLEQHVQHVRTFAPFEATCVKHIDEVAFLRRGAPALGAVLHPVGNPRNGKKQEADGDYQD
jgi:hypothetical protein